MVTTLPVPISLLDRSRTRAGEPAARALRDTVERARRAEELGFGRIWVAEHHAVPGIASGSPPLLMAAIAARTERIRVGSGGVMLPNHRPIVVAEQAKMLAALHPGRVDLGVGRSLGFTAPVRDALGVHDYGPDDFAGDVTALVDLLADAGPVTAMPKGVPAPPLFVLATGSGLAVAARLGLPDTGLISFSEMLDTLRNCCAAAGKVPLIGGFLGSLFGNLFGRGGGGEAGAVAAARVGVQRELADAQDAAADVLHAAVHAALLVAEDAQLGDLGGHGVGGGVGVAGRDAQQDEQAGAGLPGQCTVDGAGGAGDTLEGGSHVSSRREQRRGWRWARRGVRGHCRWRL